MVFGPLIGAGVGVLAGAGLGAVLFEGDRPEDYRIVTEAGDRDENLRCPAVPVIDDRVRSLIPMTPEWTTWPDYSRWVMVNRMIRLMWPKLTAAIFDEVIKVLKPMLQQTFKQIEAVEGILEDITLGGESLLGAEHHHEQLMDKFLTLGDYPVRVSGMKVYRGTDDDTCILETPAMWGSNMILDLAVYLKLGPLRVCIPIHVSNVQFKVLSRIILHMVDTFPCIGGATVTLLSLPHWDATVKVFGCPIDLMALPGVKFIADYITDWAVKQLMLYPNSVTVPVMTNYGQPLDPKGMLYVRVIKMEGFENHDLIGKQDPYVTLEVRHGRGKRTTVKRSEVNPTFNEEFFLVVDSVETQVLKLTLWDEDHLMPTDELLGEALVYFSEEKVVKNITTGGEEVVYEPAKWVAHNKAEAMVLEVYKEESKGNALQRKLSRLVSSALFEGDKDKDAVQELPGAHDAVIKVAKTRKQLKLEAEAAERARLYAEQVAAAAKQAEEARKAKEEQLKAGNSFETAEAAAEAAAAAAREELEWEWVDEEAEKAAAEKKQAEAARLKAMTRKERAAEAQRVKDEAERKRLEEEEIVLVEEKRRMRGNGPKKADLKVAGKLHVSVRFLPFERPKCDDDIETTPQQEGLAAYIPFDPPKPRMIATNVSDMQKGLLTVKLVGSSGLGKPGQLLAPDPYAEVLLVDCDPARPDDRQVSRTCKNDASPKWGDVMDFVMVSAGSILNVTVYDKEHLVDVALGKVQIPVMDVVRNGTLKSTWPLQEAESGVISMKLTWSNCFVNLDD